MKKPSNTKKLTVIFYLLIGMKMSNRSFLLCAVVLIPMLLFSFVLRTKPPSNFHATISNILEQHPASTGTVFSAKKIRIYQETKSERKPKLRRPKKVTNESERNEAKLCQKWGVLTTTSSPTEAVRRFFYKPDWCIVVVGDMEKPKVNFKFFIKTSLIKVKIKYDFTIFEIFKDYNFLEISID